MRKRKSPVRQLILTPEERRLRTLARVLTWRAIRDGVLVRPVKCDRCKIDTREITAHHIDYTKPLEVEWLCRECHNGSKKEKIRGYLRREREIQPAKKFTKTLVKRGRESMLNEIVAVIARDPCSLCGGSKILPDGKACAACWKPKRIRRSIPDGRREAIEADILAQMAGEEGPLKETLTYKPHVV